VVNLPFKVQFDAHYTYAGGFFLWSFTLFLGMASLGLATEFAITILGPNFAAFCLFPLIIANISWVPPLPPGFHSLTRASALRACHTSFCPGSIATAWPCHSTTSAASSAPWVILFRQSNFRWRPQIIFNTKNEIAMNLGILLAWIAVSCFTITLTTWLFRRKAIQQHCKEVGEIEFDPTLRAWAPRGLVGWGGTFRVW
jgi:hypothetical protein